MKNPLIGLLVICSIFASCTKQEVATTAITANALASDSHFIEIIKQEKQLTHLITQLAIEKGLTIVELKNKLNELHDKDLNSANGDPLLNAYLGVKNCNTITSLSNTYRSHWDYLNKSYGYLTILQLDTAVKQVYEKQYNMSVLNPSGSGTYATNALIDINRVNDCGWRYTLCMAAATAGGIICHVGCIGGTAGLGTPACLIICGTIELAAGVACIDGFCPIP
jgi:hypothetical protein